MAIVDLLMPKMGESIMEATILKWLKNPGDKITQDETLLEIATDKVDSEVPSTAEGVIEELLYNVNDVVPVGTVIARVRTNAEDTVAAPSNAPVINETERAEQVSAPASYTPDYSETIPSSTPHTIQSAGNRFYSPLVLNIAASEGVSMVELESMAGTGNEGRVTKKDILQFVQEKRSGNQPAAQSEQPPVTMPQAAQAPVSVPVAQQPAATQAPSVRAESSLASLGNVEIIEMDRTRKLIADHMVRSKHTSPHVTSFTEADVTNLVLWRDKVKSQFEKQEGSKITFTPLFIEAIVRCIKKYPLINSSVDGDRIIVKKDINIGMATALPNGNLIVPVIRNADQLNLVGLAKQVNGMAENARNNRLKPDDTQGGTFTLTNVGTFGSLMGTPIIPQPQVAILAVGAIKKRPVVIETAQGDSIAIRHMMYLSMSYDHRIIDGSLGATFLTAVARELENFDPNRSI